MVSHASHESFSRWLQQLFGVSLGTIPTAAHTSAVTQMVMLGTRMAVGIYNALSAALPSVTVNGQEHTVDDWGTGVAKALILIMDFAETGATIGTALQAKSAHEPGTQVITVVRWDAEGNRISALP